MVQGKYECPTFNDILVFLKTSCMEGASTLVIISTIDLYTAVQSIVYISIFLYTVWMFYYCFIKDISEHVQREVSGHIRAFLNMKTNPRLKSPIVLPRLN